MQVQKIPELVSRFAGSMAVFRRRKLARKPIFTEQYRQRFFGDPLHVCFGCSHDNERGLKLKFFKTDIGGLGCSWLPMPGLESFPNIIHGGLSGTILDELGGVVIQSEINAFALTVSSQIWYRSPIYSDQIIFGHARVVCRLKRYVLVKADIYDERARILSTMTGLYYIPSKSVFKRVTKIQEMSSEVQSYVAD